MPTDELPDVSPDKKKKKNNGTKAVDAPSKSPTIPDNVTEEPLAKEEDSQVVHSEPESDAELLQSEEVVAQEEDIQATHSETASGTELPKSVEVVEQEESIDPPQSESEAAAALMHRDESIAQEEDIQAMHSEATSGAELPKSVEVVDQEESIDSPQSESEAAAALMHRDESIVEVEDVQPSQSEPAMEVEAVQSDSDSADGDTPPEHPESVTEAEFMTSDGQDPTVIARQIGQDGDEKADVIDLLDDDSLLQQVAGVFLLWWHWAFFEITVTSPSLPIYNPPKLVQPEPISGSDDHEFVYDICDWGYKLSTSKGEEMYSVGMSMCKMFYTIEKMIYILVKRIKDEGISTETEVQVTFDGHLLAQRKAFESIINLNYNVVVTNFDPGAWGERYLEIVKRLSERGYGYPSEAPREIYKIAKRTTRPTKP